MKKKTLGIIIVSVLGAAAIFCSAMFTHQYLDAKNSNAAFDDLTNLITEIDEPQKATGGIRPERRRFGDGRGSTCPRKV